MTHFAVSVIVPDGVKDIEAAVAELLAPYDENGECFRDGSRWDWWQIGGRWDGQMTGDGVVFEEDCSACATTDGSTMVEPRKGCFMCSGTGRVRRWQANELLDEIQRNACRPEGVAEDFVPLAYVGPDGEWHERARSGWWGIAFEEDENGKKAASADDWKAEWRAALAAHPSSTVVLVDCHV